MLLLHSLPQPSLQPYISHYTFASVDNTLEFGNLKQTLFPLDIPGLCFYFPQKLVVNHEKSKITTNAYVVYTGMVTSPMSITFPANEKIRGFMVYFKLYGFADLFKLNASEATDQIPDFFSMAGKEAEIFYEQLEEAKTFQALVTIADQYFLKKLPHNDRTAQISEACALIAKSNGLIDVKTLAYKSNMTLSTLERQFTKRVGVLPKTFARFKRFHYALSLLHTTDPESLFRIAHECGYYDQAHFIKEFRQFTDISPSSYRPENYPVFQQFVVSKH